MKRRASIAIMMLAGCAAEGAARETSEVGVTVLPVPGSTTPAPRSHVTSQEQSAAAPAADPERAEGYFSEARSSMSAGRLDEACALFAKSLAAEPAIGTMFNLADCNEKLGNVLAACNGYRDVEAQARSAGQADRAELAKQRAQNLGCR